MSVATIVHQGQTVEFEDHGGKGPPLILLHSFLMNGSMFAPQLAALAGSYRCITINERGHGGTPAEQAFTYWDVARDVIAVLDHLDIGAAFVAGTSQGGFIALRVALLAPRRVRALVLMGTSASAEDAEVAASYRGMATTWVQAGPVDPLLDAVAGICLGTMDATSWKNVWRTVDGPRFDRILSTLVERDGLLERLGEISCPVLVLHGSADGAYPVAKAEQIVAGVRRAEPLVVVKGGAHFLSLTDAAEVTPKIAEFLARA